MNKQNIAASVLVVAVLVVLVSLVAVTWRINDATRPVQIQITGWPTPMPTPQPTPHPVQPGTAYRAMAAIPENLDTNDGTATGTANPQRLSGPIIVDWYDWVSRFNFHIADHTQRHIRTLLVPGCINTGLPYQRYLYTHPTADGGLTTLQISTTTDSLGTYSFNQASAWLLVTTFEDPVTIPAVADDPLTPNIDEHVAAIKGTLYDVYASSYRQHCQFVGGKYIKVSP